MIEFALPWPPKELSPNAREHWGRKARVTKQARHTAGVIAHVASVRKDHAARSLTFTFAPPDRRKRDDDNLIASLKAYRDGIADALGCDDNEFTVTYAFAAPVKGGEVRVTLSEGTPA